MVSAEYRLVTETLGLKHLHAVIGISMGGMQTFEWMVNYPGFMDEAIPIVGSPRLTGYDLLLWHAEEDALRSDPAWRGGNYTQPPPMGAVEVLHQMNHTTPANYAREHPPEKFAADYAAYLKTGILPFDANDWLSQLEAMIHHDASHGGSMDEAAKRVKARVLIVVNKQDHMVNPQPALDFAAQIGAKTLVLDSAAATAQQPADWKDYAGGAAFSMGSRPDRLTFELAASSLNRCLIRMESANYPVTISLKSAMVGLQC